MTWELLTEPGADIVGPCAQILAEAIEQFVVTERPATHDELPVAMILVVLDDLNDWLDEGTW